MLAVDAEDLGGKTRRRRRTIRTGVRGKGGLPDGTSGHFLEQVTKLYDGKNLLTVSRNMYTVVVEHVIGLAYVH